jgi:branched-chain amino acid transport system permease protein
VRFVLQSVIDASSLGCLYALIALGIALIFGILGLINFAHGELIMAGGYAFLFLQHDSWPVIVLGTALVVVVLALVMERMAFRPVRNASPFTLFVTSFAVSYLLQNLANLTVGAEARAVDLPLVLSSSFSIGPLQVGIVSALVVAVTLILILALAIFLKFTVVGVQMRAASEDFQMARLLGVRADTVIAVAFALSGLLAAAVAFALVSQSGLVQPTMGSGPVLIGFVATVVGGLGSLPAAALGGFVVGVLTVALQAVLPENIRPFRDAFVFGLVIAILVFRPQGLIVLRNRVERI